MAVLYTYPIKSTPANRDDLVIISDSRDGNKTKQIAVANLPGSASFSGIGGSGEANYIPKFSTSTDLVNSIVYDGGSKIGIGTTSPAKILDVNGDVTFGTGNKFQTITNALEGVGTNGVYLRSAISSAANPSFSNSDDTNTGMFLPGEDVLGLSTAGSERFRITNAGNVGIGTTSPSDGDLTIGTPKLHVAAAGTSGTFNLAARFQSTTSDADNTGTSILINSSNDRGLLIKAGRKDSDREVAYFDVVNAVGSTTNMLTMGKFSSVYNVGIGTTTPGAKLHVRDSSASTSTVKMSAASANSNYAYLKMTDSTANTAKLTLGTTYGYSTDKDTITLFNGSVGIGTTTPSEELEVTGRIRATGANDVLQLYRNPASQANYIKFYNTATSANEAYIGFTSNDKDLKFQNLDTTGTISLRTGSAVALRVTEAGKIGIGTTSPSNKLTVGTISGETNIACASTGFDSLRLGLLTFPAAAGWYRVAQYATASARGGARIDLCITGGDFAPVTYSIDYFKSYTQTGTEHTLKLEQYGGQTHVTKARIAVDGSNTFVEVYKNATTASGNPATMPAQVHFNRLIGESGGSFPLFGTPASGSGSTSLKEVEFIGKGTSVESLRVQGGKLNLKNLPTSTSGLVAGDIYNDGGTLKIVS
jgi:hypothetical protein